MSYFKYMKKNVLKTEFSVHLCYLTTYCRIVELCILNKKNIWHSTSLAGSETDVWEPSYVIKGLKLP